MLPVVTGYIVLQEFCNSINNTIKSFFVCFLLPLWLMNFTITVDYITRFYTK